MTLIVHELPHKWEKVSKEDRHSTVGYFVGGYRHKLEDLEIQVWRGVGQLYAYDDDGEVVVDPDFLDYDEDEIHEGVYLEHSDSTIDDEYKYVVEYYEGEVANKTILAKDKLEIADILQELFNGQLDLVDRDELSPEQKGYQAAPEEQYNDGV